MEARMIAHAALAGLLLALATPADTTDWTTDFERSGGKRTPRYAETVAYCQRLADASPWVRFTRFGTSARGRDLPLLVVTRDGAFDPDAARAAGNAVVLVQAGIHAGEIDGKDAGLMLVRDIAFTRAREALLDHVTLLFIPVFNVDGHERFGPHNRINQNGPESMGWRVTAQNLNLNRDYLKADTPEMRSWLRLFDAWQPDLFVDCHVTDGADYQYAVTYALEIFGGMDPALTEWTRERFLAPLESAMAADGIPIQRYGSFRVRHEPRSGLNSWVAPPRLSQGYTAIRNRPGLLIETHMLKDYATRVAGTYAMLRHTLAIAGAERGRLRALVAAADAHTASGAFRARPFPLTFRVGPDSVMIDFLGVAYDVIESDLTGGKWHRYGGRPVTWRIPYFHAQVPKTAVRLPEAYVIPPEWTEVIDRLWLHGVRLARTSRERTIEVDSYRFEDARWRNDPYEGRHPVTLRAEPIRERRVIPSGSVVVDMNQPAARVAAHILEPAGPDSYVYWGFFDAVFEVKEYVESYVIEAMAREMLADSALARAFAEQQRTDPEFAADTGAIRRWFHRRTPYWDDRVGVYPVGRIAVRADVEALLGP
jgi:hypothetical protein